MPMVLVSDVARTKMKPTTRTTDNNPVPAAGALRAREAGEFLAELIGLPAPISAATMWRLSRLGRIPCTYLGSRRFFRREDLRAFVAAGGSTVR
jgi:hypothetical protein